MNVYLVTVIAWTGGQLYADVFFDKVKAVDAMREHVKSMKNLYGEDVIGRLRYKRAEFGKVVWLSDVLHASEV